jgi:hypothetical protein
MYPLLDCGQFCGGGIVLRVQQFNWIDPPQGALSAAEKYLPIADEIGAISLLKNVVNTPPAILNAGVVTLRSSQPRVSAAALGIAPIQTAVYYFQAHLPSVRTQRWKYAHSGLQFALVAANIGLIAAVPDTSNELIAAQVASVPLFLALAAPLFIGAKVLDVIQGDEPVDLSGLAKLLD